MGNVLSIMLSYRLYKETKDKDFCCEKQKYSDFLKECDEILRDDISLKSKINKTE